MFFLEADTSAQLLDEFCKAGVGTFFGQSRESRLRRRRCRAGPPSDPNAQFSHPLPGQLANMAAAM